MFRRTPVYLLLGGILLAACAGAEGMPTAISPTQPPEIETPTPIPPEATVVSPPDSGGGEPTPAPWHPAPGDEKMARGPVFIETKEVIILESFPMQFVLRLEGFLPTPCNLLRAKVSPPDAQDRIQVEVYSLIERGKACIDVIQPFEVNIALGSFAEDKYTVWVNGERVGEIAP